MLPQKKILVAPLHWGLGHATRCIPIINSLKQHNYEVLLASDGAALELLRKEFPALESIELPSYQISYSKKGALFKLKMISQIPNIRKTISEERKLISRLVEDRKIDGIISDNRLGVRSKKIPSVFLTHQVNVLSGNTSIFSSKLHQNVIKKFDECWVPDLEGPVNLSGKLGHSDRLDFDLKYIGPLSRMKKKDLPIKYDILALLSGPEPQRTLLEEKLTESLLQLDKKVLLVRGVVENTEKRTFNKHIEIVNFLGTQSLETAINESELIISRSGYTTIMDLAALEKKAYFIPTPGQYEQQYLAKRLKERGLVPSCKQDKFALEKLSEVEVYSGLKEMKSSLKGSELFRLFEGE